MLIILNSILNEIIDEVKLSAMNKKRENDFYEVIQICSYKEIPDIDVAMLTSFIASICFKSIGFFWSNIFFQLIPGLLFLLFFYYFSFHKGIELEKNYMLSEIILLIIVYIFGFILVGGSSILLFK